MVVLVDTPEQIAEDCRIGNLVAHDWAKSGICLYRTADGQFFTQHSAQGPPVPVSRDEALRYYRLLPVQVLKYVEAFF